MYNLIMSAWLLYWRFCADSNLDWRGQARPHGKSSQRGKITLSKHSLGRGGARTPNDIILMYVATPRSP